MSLCAQSDGPGNADWRLEPLRSYSDRLPRLATGNQVHAIQFARRVAHTVHVFGEGRVIESGPSSQIFEDPHEEATKSLLSSVQAA
jgi:ABC-type microcin C transport system duplicated ATPase subunit YejF